MKTVLSFAIVLFISIAYTQGQQVLLLDDFNGSSINSSLWNVSLPNVGGTSTAVESGGNLTITHRATIYSVQGFNTPYNITGTYQTASPGAGNEQEQFDVYFESDFSIWTPDASYAVPTGVFVDFNTLNPSIQQLSNNDLPDSEILAQTTTPLPDGVPYNFDISVNGPLINVFINNSLLLSATSSISTGNQVGFEDGIFDGDSTSLSKFEVSSVPEPGFFGLIFGVICLTGAILEKKFRSPSKGSFANFPLDAK